MFPILILLILLCTIALLTIPILYLFYLDTRKHGASTDAESED